MSPEDQAYAEAEFQEKLDKTCNEDPNVGEPGVAQMFHDLGVSEDDIKIGFGNFCSIDDFHV